MSVCLRFPVLEGRRLRFVTAFGRQGQRVVNKKTHSMFLHIRISTSRNDKSDKRVFHFFDLSVKKDNT